MPRTIPSAHPQRRSALRLAAGLACALTLLPGVAQARTEIQWWHAMESKLGDRVNDLARRFNESQPDYTVTAVYKGNYAETMTSAIAAIRSGKAPHIVQVFEVGTATMINARGAVVSVEEMMKKAGEPFDRNAYVQAVSGYYTTAKGEMMSFPFNSSTVVMYYNRDVLKKAGVEGVPQTWEQLEAALRKVKESGASKCGFTTAWQSWAQLENFSAWHNVPFASGDNGFAGTDVKLLLDTPLHRQHITMLAKWSKEGLFTYGGRKDEGNALFFSGDCAVLTGSSASYANIRTNAKFDFGIAKLPYHEGVPGAPQNTIIGGASLWVTAGKKDDDYRGVARFFSFLSSPEIQAEWHQGTGYLPVTNAAYELTRKSGYYEKNPGTDTAVQQMIVKTTDKSRGIRLGNFPQIRDIIDEELENVWSGKQDAQKALTTIVQRGNDQLARFARTVRN